METAPKATIKLGLRIVALSDTYAVFEISDETGLWDDTAARNSGRLVYCESDPATCYWKAGEQTRGQNYPWEPTYGPEFERDLAAAKHAWDEVTA